jgi:hypothetical protein
VSLDALSQLNSVVSVSLLLKKIIFVCLCTQEIDDFDNVFASALPAGINIGYIKIYLIQSNLTVHFKPPIPLCYSTTSLVAVGKVFQYLGQLATR